MRPRGLRITRNVKPVHSRECRAIFAALSEFVDGTLPARNCRELRQHLSGCKPCLQYLDSLRKTIDLCRVYQTTPAPPLSGAVRKAFARVLTGKVGGRRS